MPSLVSRSFGCLLFLFIGCLQPPAMRPTPLNHRHIAGCYQLTVGEWRPSLGLETATHTLPHIVTLDTTSATQGGWNLTPNISYRPSPFAFPGFPRWDIRGDTIMMVWSNGFTPTVVQMRRVDDHLEGSAEAQSDMIPPGKPSWPRASVVGRRAKCST